MDSGRPIQEAADRHPHPSVVTVTAGVSLAAVVTDMVAHPVHPEVQEEQVRPDHHLTEVMEVVASAMGPMGMLKDTSVSLTVVIMAPQVVVLHHRHRPVEGVETAH